MNTACREMLSLKRASKIRLKKRVLQRHNDLSFMLIFPLETLYFSLFPKSTTLIMDITVWIHLKFWLVEIKI